jgi:ligand-binding sensor domain-containing protein
LSTLLTPKPANLLTELPAATTALTTTNASAIAFISDTVWLALPPDHGLAGWWAADTQFLGYAAPDGESLSEIAARTLATDGDGRLWAGGKGGISLWDGQEWQVARQPASALAFDAEGQLWAAQRDQLWRWDGQRWQLSGKLSGRVRIADLALAPDGTLWAATDDGVARYDGADWAWAEGFPEGYAPVHAIAADRRGRVWVAAAGGVARFDGEGWTAYDVGIGPRAEPVSIAVDVRGHVWVGYGSVAVAAGVDQFNGLRWIAHRYGIMERVGIEEIVLGPDDALWMVVRDAAALTTSAGLYRFDGRNWVLYPLP